MGFSYFHYFHCIILDVFDKRSPGFATKWAKRVLLQRLLSSVVFYVKVYRFFYIFHSFFIWNSKNVIRKLVR